MTREEISAVKDLVVHSFYHTTPNPTKFSADQVDTALKEEIKKIASNYHDFQRNKIDLFEILQLRLVNVF